MPSCASINGPMTTTEPTLPPVILLPEPSSPWPVPTGWHAHDGFEVQDQPWDLSARRLICHGTITDEHEGAAAVTALSRGVGLAVSLAVADDLRFVLLEDLHQLGEVTDAGAARADQSGGQDRLGPEHRRLLEALVDGATVTEAAHTLHMSRRTAGRRLLEIRAGLGVDSTAEAISRWAEQH